MSSPQAIDTEKIERAAELAAQDATREKQDRAVEGATAKRLAAVEGLDAGFDTTDTMAQMGRPLTRDQIVQRLQRLNGNLRFMQSIQYPRIGAVYVFDGVSNLDDPLYSGLRHIVGMEWLGPSPEFTIRTVEADRWGVKQMVGQIRGWRLVLARLIKERLITLEGAEREFAISRGRDSSRWWEMMC